MLVCVPVYVCVTGCLKSHWEHREGLKDGGGEVEEACFVPSVGGERLFALFCCNQTPENKKLATRSCIESGVDHN